MLTLITGAPGAGKTAAVVNMLGDLGKDRPLFVYGLNGLTIPHVPLVDPQKWFEEVPDGACIIIDEVQDVWRPSGPGQKIPESITRLETHRHHGLDFFLTTQGPNLVHANVRALVGRHVHLRDLGFLGRWWYEWPETADNCRTGWKNAPLKKKYKLPKQIFSRYKSASVHVKPVRSFPVMVFVLAAALVGVAVLTYYAYRSISSKMTPAKPAPVAVPAMSTGAAPAPTVSTARYLDEGAAFASRMFDRPWTAPAYDSMRVVVAVPYITGAICVNDQCTCYHHKGKLLDVSSSACLRWANDRPFNPYVVPETPGANSSPSVAPSAPPGATNEPGQPVAGSGSVQPAPSSLPKI